MAWVHQLQTATLLLVGLLLAAAPRSRFGHSYDFMLQVPGARYGLAAIYLATGVVMAFAMRAGSKPCMGWGLRIGGINTLALAVFLIVGATTGPTGILGPVFTGYLGLHLIFQSLLLNDHR